MSPGGALASQGQPEMLDGRFVLSRQVASGAMGSVHQAWDTLAGEQVAIKLLHTDSVRYTERFEREATLLAELRHPTVVRYVAHGRRSSGDPYSRWSGWRGTRWRLGCACKGSPLSRASR